MIHRHFPATVAVIAALTATAISRSPGQTPTPAPAPAAAAPAPAAPMATNAPAPASETPADRPATYTIVQGDTLWSISHKFNTSIHALMKLNGLKKHALLHIGQVIKIPPATTDATAK